MNWQTLHHEIMQEYQQKPLSKHIWVFGIGFGLGIFFGLLLFQDLNVVLMVWLMTLALDYVLFQNELFKLLSPHPPYWLQGNLIKKIKKEWLDEKQEIIAVSYFFEIEVLESNTFSFKEGLQQKSAKIDNQTRIEVPESMFLSFKQQDMLYLICTPNHQVYGWVQMNRSKPKRVIRIEK